MLKDIKDRSPNQGTVQHLEEALEQAKKGELRSVVMMKGYDDGTTTHGWSLDDRTPRLPFLGALVLLQNDLATNTGLEFGDSILSSCFEDA